jgi:REP element-mobilizing transposase RayT
MSMTREDMLRELELLPVWRLKKPLANDVACATTPDATVAQATSPAEDLKSPNDFVVQAPPPANPAKKTDNPNLTQGIHQRGYLPHLKAEGGVYAVTFRLHDSLPANILAHMADLAANEKDVALEAQLNAGHGECLLAQPVIAEMLKQVLLAKHSQDYHLHAWVIMPNHVHLLVEPLNSCVLSDILQAIKSISARQANQLLAREGAFWQRESYDHLVRDEDDFNHALEYIEQNPVKANLVKLSHEYALGSAFANDVACKPNHK